MVNQSLRQVVMRINVRRILQASLNRESFFARQKGEVGGARFVPARLERLGLKPCDTAGRMSSVYFAAASTKMLFAFTTKNFASRLATVPRMTT
jgi:hypothetical protein